MSRRSVPTLVLLSVCSALVVHNVQKPAAAWQPSAPQRQLWEYKSIIEIAKNDIAVSENGLLNQAGMVGWELVAVTEGPAPTARQYILKRLRTPRE
ncbi:MAG TPA: hypothetical protein VM510_06350 [Caulifigura sp.]|jgi:hypothetical protein|nr:hypothetical protein [Caulifigura sp.]